MTIVSNSGAWIDAARSMTTPWEAIQGGLSAPTHYLRAVILDLFWKFLWLVFTLAGFWMTAALLISIIGSTPYEGPDLGQLSPIIWVGIAAQLWQTYASMIAGIGIAFVVVSVLLWLLLEALFRGGSSGFRIYFATGIARTATLVGTAGFLGAMVLQGRNAGTAVIAVLVLSGVWFLMITAETLVRRDAIDLIGIDLGTVMAVSASFFCAELAGAILLWGAAAFATLLSSTETQVMLSLLLSAFVFLVWMVFHSLLVAVRFSTIDFMRRSLGDE